MPSITKSTKVLNFVLYLALVSLQNSAITIMTSQTKSDNSFRIYFVTWNVATKFPEQNLHSMLNLTTNVTEQDIPDMYVVGLQEVQSQPQDMVINAISGDSWSEHFRETLRTHDYVKLHTQRMQGLVLNVFCLRKHLDHLRLIEYQYTRTGFYGFWGNKGAVGIRMNLYGINICFINAHLTPHDHQLADRIRDYETILTQHKFENLETSNILFHDYVFWIGDLNFRLNNGLSALDIVELVKKNETETLLTKDQLVMVMKNNEAFSEFMENKVTFPPTYKYEFASQEFDLKRRPSWTDRILFKLNPMSYEDIELKAEQRHYKSHPFYIQSDHKPVSGEFNIITRPNFEELGVEITVPEWYLEEDNRVNYRYLGDYKPEEIDWIALFHEGFSSLDDYVVYEYIGTVPNDQFQTTNTENHIHFSSSAAKDPGIYRLIYFGQKKSALSILGISHAFPINRRLPSNN